MSRFNGLPSASGSSNISWITWVLTSMSRSWSMKHNASQQPVLIRRTIECFTALFLSHWSQHHSCTPGWWSGKPGKGLLIMIIHRHPQPALNTAHCLTMLSSHLHGCTKWWRAVCARIFYIKIKKLFITRRKIWAIIQLPLSQEYQRVSE